MGSSGETEVSDEALIGEALEGRVSALETLLKRHEGKVLRVVRLLGVAHADREDVAQEVFVRVFRHLGTFRKGRSFEGWLYRVTVNATHDWRQQARRRSQREVGWSEGLEQSPDAAPGPAGRLERDERRRRLEQALDVLTERERAVFVLRELAGLESREVARSLGISSITIRRHLSRARRRLQEVLSEKNEKKEAGD